MSSNKFRIVVSGATGNTGVGVVETLSKSGHEVVAISRSPSSDVSKRLASLPGVTVVKGEEAFNKPVDRVYLCFAPVPTHFTDETEFLRQAVKAKVKYIVKLSTGEAYLKDPLDSRFYARSHNAIEHILEQGSIPYTILRANLFFSWLGFDLDEVKKTKKFRTFIGDSPSACINPIDVGKAAGALLALSDPSAHYSKKYHLSGPEDITSQSMATDLSEILGEKITYERAITEDEYIAIFESIGVPKVLAEAFRGSMAEYQQSSNLTRAVVPTSPPLLSLAPPSSTFKQFIQEHYASKK